MQPVSQEPNARKNILRKENEDPSVAQKQMDQLTQYQRELADQVEQKKQLVLQEKEKLRQEDLRFEQKFQEQIQNEQQQISQQKMDQNNKQSLIKQQQLQQQQPPAQKHHHQQAQQPAPQEAPPQFQPQVIQRSEQSEQQEMENKMQLKQRMFVDNNQYKYESYNYNNNFQNLLQNNYRMNNKFKERQDSIIHQLDRMKSEQQHCKLIDPNFYDNIKKQSNLQYSHQTRHQPIINSPSPVHDLQHVNQFPNETYWVDKSSIDSYFKDNQAQDHQFKAEAKVKQSQFQSQNSEFIQLTESQIVRQQEEIRNMDREFHSQRPNDHDSGLSNTHELLNNISQLNKGPLMQKYDNHSPIDEQSEIRFDKLKALFQESHDDLGG